LSFAKKYRNIKRGRNKLLQYRINKIQIIKTGHFLIELKNETKTKTQEAVGENKTNSCNM